MTLASFSQRSNYKQFVRQQLRADRAFLAWNVTLRCDGSARPRRHHGRITDEACEATSARKGYYGCVELTPDAVAELVEKARDRFLKQRRRRAGTMRAVAAEVLFDMLRDDIRKNHALTPTTKINRDDLRDRVTNHPSWERKAAPPKSSFGGVPDALGRELRDFPFKAPAAGTWWRLKFEGPLDSHRPNYPPDGAIYLAVSCKQAAAPDPQSDEDASAFASSEVKGFKSQCFICSATAPQFDVNDRVCRDPECPSNCLPDPSGYVALMPEPDMNAYDGLRPHREMFKIVGREDEVPPARIDAPLVDINALIPYRTDHLAALELDLGTALLYRYPKLETGTRFDVYVLDMSAYSISNTLKDPKSWAVVNLAIEKGIETLAVYTAGNAGLSLAKLVYEARRRSGKSLTAYALVDKDVPVSIRSVLRAWGCDLEELDDDEIPVSRSELWKALNARADRASAKPLPGVWDVSEGWDGIGVLMYRALFADLLTKVHVDFLVVPIGQGNLFIGAYLGIQDAKSGHTHLVGAVPLGENILQNCTKGMTNDVADAEKAVAPKLTGKHTPLARLVCHLIQKSDEVSVIEVSREMQCEAVERGDILRRIASEPSAMIAFGALRGDKRQKHGGLRELLRGRAESKQPATGRTVVVINSGLGLCDEADADFISKLPKLP